jgi:hypothetical protein
MHGLDVGLQTGEVRQHSADDACEVRGGFCRFVAPRGLTPIAASTIYVHDTILLARSGAIHVASTAAYRRRTINRT